MASQCLLYCHIFAIIVSYYFIKVSTWRIIVFFFVIKLSYSTIKVFCYFIGVLLWHHSNILCHLCSSLYLHSTNKTFTRQYCVSTYSNVPSKCPIVHFVCQLTCHTVWFCQISGILGHPNGLLWCSAITVSCSAMTISSYVLQVSSYVLCSTVTWILICAITLSI